MIYEMLCDICEQPLSIAENGEPFSIGPVAKWLPDTKVHDICREAEARSQRDKGLHKLYCHLPECEWIYPAWRPWEKSQKGT
jgi:hypothetical protein